MIRVRVTRVTCVRDRPTGSGSGWPRRRPQHDSAAASLSLCGPMMMTRDSLRPTVFKVGSESDPTAAAGFAGFPPADSGALELELQPGSTAPAAWPGGPGATKQPGLRQASSEARPGAGRPPAQLSTVTVTPPANSDPGPPRRRRTPAISNVALIPGPAGNN
jgi:hypothetical protein